MQVLQSMEHLSTQTPEELGTYLLLHEPHLPSLHLSQLAGHSTHLELTNYSPVAHSVHEVISELRQSEQVAEQPRQPPAPLLMKPLRQTEQVVVLVQVMQFLLQDKHPADAESKNWPGGHSEQLVAEPLQATHAELHKIQVEEVDR